MEQKTPGLVKATLILSILALVFALLPLLSGWFLLLMWLRWVLGIAAIVCGVIAFTKKYEPKKLIISGVLVIAAVVLPSMLAETYAEKALESAANATKAAVGAGMNASKNAMEGAQDYYGNYGF